MTPGAALDRLAELEDERRFLLRSLADLEREHDAGDIDDDDYVTLRDGYTSRAAAVLRAIDERKTVLPSRTAWRRSTVVLWIVGTIVVAVVAGVLLARASGQRVPEADADQPINDVAALLSQARQTMEVDPLRAKLLYERVLELEPTNVEATTYTGWLFVALADGAGGEAASLALDQARTSLTSAVEMDPTYADAHCFLAIVAMVYDGDVAAAQSEIAACFENNPPADLRQFVQQQVDGMAATIDSTTTTAPAP